MQINPFKPLTHRDELYLLEEENFTGEMLEAFMDGLSCLLYARRQLVSKPTILDSSLEAFEARLNNLRHTLSELEYEILPDKT
jgi:hypothetical protein